MDLLDNIELTDLERANYTALNGYCRQFNRKFFEIAYVLDFFKADERYKKFNCDTFNDFCMEKFRLEKSLVSRLLKSWERFAETDRNGKLTKKVKKEYKDYGFSQLVELLPLSDDDIACTTPEMTVKQLRDFKKKLKEEKEGTPNRTPELLLQELQSELLNSLGSVCDNYPGSLFMVSRNTYVITYENYTYNISLDVKGLS